MCTSFALVLSLCEMHYCASLKTYDFQVPVSSDPIWVLSPYEFRTHLNRAHTCSEYLWVQNPHQSSLWVMSLREMHYFVSSDAICKFWVLVCSDPIRVLSPYKLQTRKSWSHMSSEYLWDLIPSSDHLIPSDPSLWVLSPYKFWVFVSSHPIWVLSHMSSTWVLSPYEFNTSSEPICVQNLYELSPWVLSMDEF